MEAPRKPLDEVKVKYRELLGEQLPAEVLDSWNEIEPGWRPRCEDVVER